MPCYNFRNKETGEIKEVNMRISDLAEWKEENPGWVSYFPMGSKVNFTSESQDIISKTPEGFNDLMNQIKSESGRDNTIRTK
jgi:hypothetical protein